MRVEAFWMITIYYLDKNRKETTVSTFRILEKQKACQLARTMFRLSSMRLSKRNIVLNKFRRQRNVQRHRASQKSH